MIGKKEMQHLALLGDSIFDNAAYVAGTPAVIDQVRKHLPDGWAATLLAVDGNVAADVKDQLERLPSDVTHLALSVGGNDALGVLAQLYSPTPLPMMQALKMLAQIQVKFETDYALAIDAAIATAKPLLICTIYDQVPGLPQELRSSLSLFNDVIVRTGARRGIPVLDLRAICTEASDYSTLSPIEPSCTGGEKIAKQLVNVLLNHNFEDRRCQIHT